MYEKDSLASEARLAAEGRRKKEPKHANPAKPE
jgi:hypothetical protein